MIRASTPTRRLAVAMVAVAGLVGTVTACQRDDSGSAEVASIDDEGETATDDTTAVTTGPEDMEEAVLAFAECMREHGIDMPDPEITDDGGVAIAIQVNPGNEADMEAAHEACEPIMEHARSEVEIDPAREAEMREEMLEFAECMREHGIDMPDPEFERGRVTGRVEGGRGIDPGSDDVAAAAEACGRDGMFMSTRAAPPSGRD